MKKPEDSFRAYEQMSPAEQLFARSIIIMSKGKLLKINRDYESFLSVFTVIPKKGTLKTYSFKFKDGMSFNVPNIESVE